MRRATQLANALVAMLLAAGCRSREASPDAGPPARWDSEGFGAGDSVGGGFDTPVVVTGPSVVVFWLPAADTLHPDDAAAAFDELSTATEEITGPLKAYDIPIYATHAETLYVELPTRERRPILLSGLDLPFGYVLLEPGDVERILTGMYAGDELLEEIRVYFDLPADSVPAPPKITT